MSHCDKILEYMEQYGSITPLDALREFGCMRLAARISDLEHRGIKIISSMETGLNRNGEKVKYARYSLAS